MNFDWNKYDADVKDKILGRTKSGSIAFLKEMDELTTWKIYHAHWEDWLSSSDYFKNWWEKINSFQTKKEVNFYADKLKAFMDFVKEHTQKDVRFVENAKPWDPVNTPKLIEQELKRLENISEEEFKKEDKFAGIGFKELSIEEMKNDPWFNKQIDNLFGLENGELPKEKKTNKKGDEELGKQNVFNSKNTQQPTNKSSLTPLLIGGAVLLVIIGLVSFLFIKGTKKVKKQN